MSDVYLAEQINLHDRAVVVKIFPATQSQASQERLELFREESKTLANVDRQSAANIVFPIDFDVFDEYPYLVMEHVVGETVAEYANSTTPNASSVLQIISSAAQALADAHRLDIVHGDIKPSNMIVRPDQTVQLIDFGLSAFFKEDERLRAGGTPRYAAPEQLSGQKVDARTDLYGLGVVLKDLLEEVPTENQTQQDRKLSREATQLAIAMTVDAKEQRPASASEVVSRLEGMTNPGHQRGLRLLLSVAGVLILLLAIVWMWGAYGASVGSAMSDPEVISVLEWVESVGGKYKLDEFGSVCEVDLNNCWVDNEAIQKLNVFEDLGYGLFANSKVDADGIAMLDQPLSTLVLAGTNTDDRIFGVLKKFRVTCLDLSGTKITGEGLKSIPTPERLDSLGLADMPVTDEHAETIGGMKRLRLLNLRSTKFTAAGLRKIAHLELEQLDLGQCPIEDKAIDELVKFPSLERVVLSNCDGLTSNCIDGLLTMKNLTSIEFANCHFSDEQILRLKSLSKLNYLLVGARHGRDLEMLRREFGPRVKVD